MRRFGAMLSMAALSLGCRYAPIAPSTLAARTVDVEARLASGRSLAVSATYFPVTHRNASTHAPIILSDPVFWRRELLHRGRDGGLIAELNYAGFPVWVVYAQSYDDVSMDEFGEAFAELVPVVAKRSGRTSVYVGGLSFGGQAVLAALERLDARGAIGGVHIDRVFFLGSGFDYGYSGSFLDNATPLRGHAASELCDVDEQRGCGRFFRGGARAKEQLGILPGASERERLPRAERYAYVTKLRLPVLFIAGKIDGVAPSETSYPIFQLWGSVEADPRRTPKLFLLAGRENRFHDDYDAYTLLAGDAAADDVYDYLRNWLMRSRNE